MKKFYFLADNYDSMRLKQELKNKTVTKLAKNLLFFDKNNGAFYKKLSNVDFLFLSVQAVEDNWLYNLVSL